MIAELEYYLLDPGEDLRVTSFARDRSGECSATWRSSKEGEAWKQGLERRGEQATRRNYTDRKSKQRTPGFHGKKAEVERMGAPKESEEALSRDMMVLDDVISQMERERCVLR